MQKKTFTKWVNSHLARVTCRVGDLYSDLRDGRNLLRLLEVLSGETLVSCGHEGKRGPQKSVQGDQLEEQPSERVTAQGGKQWLPLLRGWVHFERLCHLDYIGALIRGDRNSGPIENISFSTYSGCN